RNKSPPLWGGATSVPNAWTCPARRLHKSDRTGGRSIGRETRPRRRGETSRERRVRDDDGRHLAPSNRCRLTGDEGVRPCPPGATRYLRRCRYPFREIRHSVSTPRGPG